MLFSVSNLPKLFRWSNQSLWTISKPLLICIFLSIAAVGLTGCGSSGGDPPDFSQMVINLGAVMPDLLALVTATSYLVGIVMVVKGTYKLREYGELRTMMSSQTSIWPIVFLLVSGFALVYFPTSFEVGMGTLFVYTSPLTYPGGSSDQDELINAVVLMMQVIGSIAFVRGFIILSTATQQGAQPGSFGKAITFIVGGILAINMYGTWDMLVNTLVG